MPNIYQLSFILFVSKLSSVHFEERFWPWSAGSCRKYSLSNTTRILAVFLFIWGKKTLMEKRSALIKKYNWLKQLGQICLSKLFPTGPSTENIYFIELLTRKQARHNPKKETLSDRVYFVTVHTYLPKRNADSQTCIPNDVIGSVV